MANYDRPEYLDWIWEFGLRKEKPDWLEYEKIIRQALIDHPEDDYRVLYELMINMRCQSKPKECIEIGNQLLEMTDDDEQKSEIYLEQGERYGEMGEKDKQIEYYKKSIAFDKKNVSAISFLSDIYYKNSEWENAIELYKLFDDNDHFYKWDKFFNSGFAYAMLDKKAEAIECFEKYIEFEPKDTSAISNLGALYGQTERWDDSIKLFKKVLEIDPQNASAYYSLGVSYNGIGDYYMAMHYYLEALKIQPDYPEVYNNMGAIAFTNEGDSKKGIEYLEKALELIKEDNTLRGTLYLSLTRINRKLTNFERADYYKAKFMGLLGYEMIEDDDEEDEDDEE